MKRLNFLILFVCFSHLVLAQSGPAETLETIPLGPPSSAEGKTTQKQNDLDADSQTYFEDSEANKIGANKSFDLGKPEPLDPSKRLNNSRVEEKKELSVKRHFGINAAPLLANLAPFNEARDLRLGSYNMAFYRIKNDYRMFRFGLGIQISEENTDRNHLNLRIGSARVFSFNDKWRHYRGLDLRIFGGSFNLPEDTDDGDAGIGIAPLYGIEYEVLPRFTISTETSLFIGATGDGFLARFFPPFSLFLNVYFN